MKIGILSNWGGGTALGWRMAKEGHQVLMHIENEDYKTVGNGFVPKASSVEQVAAFADFIILDDGGLGKIGDKLRAKGKVVWGGSEWSDEIENDRGKGQEAFKQIGMKVIPSKEFSSIPEASSFVKSSPKRYVVKPSGTIQDEKALSYVGKRDDGSDMLSMLDQYQQKWAGKIKSLEIQEFKKGVEVGISGFFNGAEFVEPIEITFEHKKLMNGDIGPSTGEMGTSMIWISKQKKIYKDSIGKAVDLLAKNKYIGYVDINCIAEGKNLWPLEWTPRFGYPTIHLKMETIAENIGNMFFAIAQGKKSLFKISNPYGICVVLATPPYPFASKDIYKKYGEDQEVAFSTKDRKGIWPSEVYRDKDNDWFLTGESGFSVIVTGSGKNLDAARKMAYDRIKGVTIPNMMYRTDIGEKTSDNLRILKSDGWFA